VAAALYFFLMPTLVVIVAGCTAFYVLSSHYKMFLVSVALSSSNEVRVDPDEMEALDDKTLPVYTVLLPLYREADVVHRLLSGIEALDYPKSRLDVKLLLEEEDRETIAAVESAHLPEHYHVLMVPTGGPKGKPKALNYGLLYARGKYCVVYDAEDRPEPDQLKKAVVAFGKAEPRVGCIQAKLNFYNPDQNLLTKWFTVEYSSWFDLYLPGLARSGATIPLGGTSNHFPTEVLRDVGGWDPFNVTEDADLGIRLARRKWKTAIMDSVTYEEANSRLGNWMRQRSHWHKGYMQTWLVHMRNPFRLWRELGTHGFFSVQMTIAGTIFGCFANPVFWALVGIWYATESNFVHTLFPTPVLYMGTLALFAGNFAFVYVGIAGCLRRKYYQGSKYCLLMPLYWLLMSIASIHALYQLVRKPHYWEKTVHGLCPDPHGAPRGRLVEAAEASGGGGAGG
jgi:cellulose synthase/poly-beta-1,6-N-acetylglucosamine synthase-like glycosyltransferase